jgi:hypothetical protein
MEKKVFCKDVTVKSVSSPDTIKLVADERGINPQEVFVRIVFEHEGAEYKASNKLRFLTKAGYEKLIDSVKNGTKVDLTVDTEAGFFYIEYGTTVDDLFSTPVSKESSLTDLSKLLVGV